MRKTIESMFPKMTELVKPGQQGVASVKHFTVSKADSERTLFYSAIRGERWGEVPAGRYVQLTVNGELTMTDTKMERMTNYEFLNRANGRVLIAGLGLGMIVHAALGKPDVSHITVLEKYQDVVDLVAPSVERVAKRRLSIVTADALTWAAPKGQKWDTIYFDIWPNVCQDNLEEAAKLSRKYSPRLNRANPKRWMGGWRIDELRADRDADRRGGW